MGRETPGTGRCGVYRRPFQAEQRCTGLRIGAVRGHIFLFYSPQPLAPCLVAMSVAGGCGVVGDGDITTKTAFSQIFRTHFLSYNGAP